MKNSMLFNVLYSITLFGKSDWLQNSCKTSVWLLVVPGGSWPLPPPIPPLPYFFWEGGLGSNLSSKLDKRNKNNNYFANVSKIMYVFFVLNPGFCVKVWRKFLNGFIIVTVSMVNPYFLYLIIQAKWHINYEGLVVWLWLIWF